MITITPIFVYRDDTNTWVPTNETFTREEVAKKLGISRTTLWRHEHWIVIPAKILDYYRYVDAHSKELDWYCIWVLYSAIGLRKGEGSYEKAAVVMKSQQLLYLRRDFDEYVNQLVNQANKKRRKVA